MNKEEARKIVVERKEMAERVIRSSSLLQNHTLVAMGAKEMADWLLACLDGNTPWH